MFDEHTFGVGLVFGVPFHTAVVAEVPLGQFADDMHCAVEERPFERKAEVDPNVIGLDMWVVAVADVGLHSSVQAVVLGIGFVRAVLVGLQECKCLAAPLLDALHVVHCGLKVAEVEVAEVVASGEDVGCLPVVAQRVAAESAECQCALQVGAPVLLYYDAVVVGLLDEETASAWRNGHVDLLVAVEVAVGAAGLQHGGIDVHLLFIDAEASGEEYAVGVLCRIDFYQVVARCQEKTVLVGNKLVIVGVSCQGCKR